MQRFKLSRILKDYLFPLEKTSKNCSVPTIKVITMDGEKSKEQNWLEDNAATVGGVILVVLVIIIIILLIVIYKSFFN